MTCCNAPVTLGSGTAARPAPDHRYAAAVSLGLAGRCRCSSSCSRSMISIPRAISYFGFNLMLNLAIPVALATAAQICIITVNDLDLSIGAYVGFIACVTATWLPDTPLLGAAVILGSIAVYAALGALVQLRQLPSIVVTLGMSFVWLGLALLVRPQPGRQLARLADQFHRPVTALRALPHRRGDRPRHRPAFHPHADGLRCRAARRGRQSGRRSPAPAGRCCESRSTAYAMAGAFGSLAGIALVGVSSSADANMANGYTLLSIAGAILGGAEFIGGRISPIGAVIGALTLQLAAVALNFFQLPALLPGFRIPPEWQVGAQGLILILILAVRAFINRSEA